MTPVNINEKRIVIKVGTSTITNDNMQIDIRTIDRLSRVLSGIAARGYEVVLVSSGAIAVGAGKMRFPEKPKELRVKQAAAAVGQCELMHIYDKLFGEYGHLVGQILLDNSDVDVPERRENLRNTFDALLENGIIPIVNENDTVSLSELMFTDNDELSGVIATMMECDHLVILSNVDGVFDGDPADPTSQVIPFVRPGDDLDACVREGKSPAGRGGMSSKMRVARSVAAKGIEVVVACGRRENILIDLVDGAAVPCTTFIPA